MEVDADYGKDVVEVDSNFAGGAPLIGEFVVDLHCYSVVVVALAVAVIVDDVAY